MDLYIDDRGFLWYGDFKLPCRLDTEHGTLEFKDKDHRKSERRGTEFVEVPIPLISILADAPPQQKTELLKE